MLLLAALYGTLFGLLQSEDNALLLGSLLLFAILTGIMIATRRFNWYGVGRGQMPPQTPASGIPSSGDDRHIADMNTEKRHADAASPDGSRDS